MSTTAGHWEQIHGTTSTDVSWWQPREDLWLDLLDGLPLDTAAPIVDVGAGSSVWVDAMLDRGFQDVTAVDIADSALERVRTRLGTDPRLHLVVADVCTLRLGRQVALWHDRAVLHFLTTDEERSAYVATLLEHLAPGGYAVIAGFAEDGPESCSGLPVRRHSPEELAAVFAPHLASVRAGHRTHRTPWGAEQRFSIQVLRRSTGVPSA